MVREIYPAFYYHLTLKSKGQLEKFHFRNLHPQVLIGTASDCYAGWLGQIYSQERYQGRITKRTKVVAGKSFTEEVLPVDSVEEYFSHFSVLEIDFTFYRLLLDHNGQPTQNYQVLTEIMPQSCPRRSKIGFGNLSPRV